jgi:ABC-type Fe3+/spermidine/putrescine transport system ATPase subunit
MNGALSIANVSHSYGTTPVVRDISIDIPEGEFLTLLGPSGCGKTTLLRIIAGFITPTSGQLRLGERNLLELPPHKRPVNMVFQRPTLFPHLDVFENVAFGLRLANVSKGEIKTRVGEALDLVRLPGMERRRPTELSGGQTQRVALARALVNRPRVLLLDEPLSALDLQIRLEMEVELRRVHRETGATFVYVTHDQREALALSDRVAVFSAGQIDQIAPPTELYARPATPFVARFVGDANVVPVHISRDGGQADLVIGGRRLEGGASGTVLGPGWLVLRSEALRLAAPGDRHTLGGVVRDVAFRGTGFSYRVAIDGIDTELKAELPASAGAPVAIGSPISLALDLASCWVLPRDGDAPVSDFSPEPPPTATPREEKSRA